MCVTMKQQKRRKIKEYLILKRRYFKRKAVNYIQVEKRICYGHTAVR